MNFTTSLPLVSSIFTLFLGASVFLKDYRSKINLIFFFFSLAVFVWLFGTFMMFYSVIDEKALWWDKFVYIGVIFIPSLLYHFISVFIEKEKEKIVMVIVGYALSFFFLILNVFSNIFIDDIYKYSWGVHSKAQFFHHIFLFFFFGYILLFFRDLFVFFRHATGIKKEQSKYLFISLIVLDLGAVAFLPAYNINFFNVYPFAYLSGLFFTIILAYTIIRHRLMDIKFVLRRSSVFFASFFSMLILVGVSKFFIAKLNYSRLAEFFIDFAILTIAVLIFPYIKSYYYRIANKYFFTTLYDSQLVIAEISDQLSSTLEVKKIYKNLYRTFTKTFRIKSFGIVMLDEEGKNYKAVYNKGFQIKNRKYFPVNKNLEKVFLRKGNPIVVEELLATIDEYDSSVEDTIEMLKGLGVEVLAPLEAKKRSIGLIVLGRKESGDMFNDMDIQLMRIIGTQATISIENAALYEEVKRFNSRLENEIKEATTDLQEANTDLKDLNTKLTSAYEKLKKLDRAKSEFLSIASHQLRTPLTSIKGFTSLLLEGTYGNIATSVRATLEKIYISNERLIKLVEDLLNISRIESGRIAFDFKEDKIDALVNEIVDSMKIAAKNKNLILKYNKPEKAMLSFVFDSSKMKEVVSNLIDNAIKYTKQGIVSVSLKDMKTVVQIAIEDSGIGIRKGELEYIFERFQRGKDVNQVHTEGIGLGLYVCKKIIESHKGNLWAESDGPGKGSRFIIQLKKSFRIPKAQQKNSISSKQELHENS